MVFQSKGRNGIEDKKNKEEKEGKANGGTPCLASPQPQVSYPRAGPSPPSLIHMVELGFVGLSNNPKRIIAQWQKLEVKLART